MSLFSYLDYVLLGCFEHKNAVLRIIPVHSIVVLEGSSAKSRGKTRKEVEYFYRIYSSFFMIKMDYFGVIQQIYRLKQNHWHRRTGYTAGMLITSGGITVSEGRDASEVRSDSSRASPARLALLAACAAPCIKPPMNAPNRKPGNRCCTALSPDCDSAIADCAASTRRFIS